VPSISLATVYKNIHLFVESGVFRKMSMHHGSVRVEMNEEAHHHLVCSKCGTATGSADSSSGDGGSSGSASTLAQRSPVRAAASARSDSGRSAASTRGPRGA